MGRGVLARQPLLVLLLLTSSVLVLVTSNFPTAASPLNLTAYHSSTSDSKGLTRARIIGGSNARAGEFPWQVSLQRPQFGIPNEFCGGVILNPTEILTAAHCFYDFVEEEHIPWNDVVVVAGAVDIANTDGSEQAIPVSGYRRHPSFNPLTMDNDLGVLTLRSPLTYGPNVNFIRLAASGTVPSGKCIAVGWGETEDPGTPVGSILQKVELDIVSNSECNSRWAPHGDTITENMVCGHKTGQATCNGDSGSGFICTSNNQPYLAGVVSWGQTANSCIEIPELPSVFTNIAKFTSWI